MSIQRFGCGCSVRDDGSFETICGLHEAQRAGCSACDEMAEELSSLRARLAEAREALAPFAAVKFADALHDDEERLVTRRVESVFDQHDITVGDFRRAARVLSAPSSPEPVLPPDAPRLIERRVRPEPVVPPGPWAIDVEFETGRRAMTLYGDTPDDVCALAARTLLALRGEVRRG